MSGVCDTCQRDKCRLRMDGLKMCDMRLSESNYERLFGTPERAAETLKSMCISMEECSHCPLYASGVDFCEGGEGDGVAKWMESEVRDD